MNTKYFLKSGSGISLFAIILASCASTSASQEDWNIWSYTEATDACEVSEIVKDYNSSGAFRNGAPKIGALLTSGEDAFLTQRYRDSDKDLLQYVVADSRFTTLSDCRSEFEIERSLNGVREGRSIQYEFVQINGRLCKESAFAYRLGAAANNRMTTGTITSCVETSTGAFSFNIART